MYIINNTWDSLQPCVTQLSIAFHSDFVFYFNRYRILFLQIVEVFYNLLRNIIIILESFE
jgi:hypothetical protein